MSSQKEIDSTQKKSQESVQIPVNDFLDIQETMQNILDNMEHYLENRCCPTPDEVREVRLLAQQINQYAEVI